MLTPLMFSYAPSTVSGTCLKGMMDMPTWAANTMPKTIMVG